jgi:A/G-specific adenine glycosylase
MAKGFTKALMEWHRHENDRSMPWKGEKDPYKVWLSEVILQQTRVEQGRGYYERFVEAYPDVSSLAAASDRDVFKLWEGLGYYSRCRNLLETARRIARDCGGVFPNTHPGLLALKGVGPYTAAAIASFAFGLPHAVVDGNVVRVLARVFGMSETIDKASSRRAFAELAQSLLDRSDPGAFNQAMMDFGAVVCKPASPLCGSCFMAGGCVALSKGLVDALPVKKPKSERRRRWIYYVHVSCGGSILVRERQGRDIWRGLNELYSIESEESLTLNELASHPLLWTLTQGNALDHGAIGREYLHILTHQEIRGRFLALEIPAPRPVVPGYRWVRLKEVEELAFPKPVAEYLRKKR